MSHLRPISLILLISSLFVFGTVPSPTEQRPSQGNFEHFQALLAEVTNADIHAVLHEWSGRFKDGVFPEDRTALEAVHSEDPATASQLVKLAKRQGDPVANTTITVPSTTTTIPSTTITTSSTTTLPPPTSSSTDIQSSAVAPTIPTQASIVSTSAGAVIISSDNGGLTTASSSTVLISYEPSSTTVLVTTTLSGGVPAVVTSVEVVQAAATTMSLDPEAVAAGSGAQPEASLQAGGANASRKHSQGSIAALVGAIAISLMI